MTSMPIEDRVADLEEKFRNLRALAVVLGVGWGIGAAVLKYEYDRLSSLQASVAQTDSSIALSVRRAAVVDSIIRSNQNRVDAEARLAVERVAPDIVARIARLAPLQAEIREARGRIRTLHDDVGPRDRECATSTQVGSIVVHTNMKGESAVFVCPVTHKWVNVGVSRASNPAP
jgi:hypothetical protein